MSVYAAGRARPSVLRRCPLLWMWLIGAMIGLLFAMTSVKYLGETLRTYMEQRSKTEVSGRAFLRCLLVNGRFMAFLVGTTYFPFSGLWLKMLLVSYGFSFGFTAAVMAGAYGFFGFLGAACSYIPHNLFLLPVIYAVSFRIREDTPGPRPRLWLLAALMALLSAFVETRTAPLIFGGLLGGRL